MAQKRLEAFHHLLAVREVTLFIHPIRKNETSSSFGSAPEVARSAPHDRRDPARLAAQADDPQPCHRMCEMRERRRSPALGSHCELPRWTHAPVQLAPRTGGRGAPLAAQLSKAEGGDRGYLRDQPRAAASGTGPVEAPEQAP